MSFINSSIAINGSLTPFNIGNNTSILPLNLTQAQDYLSNNSLINSIVPFSNESPMNVKNAANIFSSNRKIDRVTKVKIGNGFTDPKYGNIPRSKRIRARHTRSIDIPFDGLTLERNACENSLVTCEEEKLNITLTKEERITYLTHRINRLKDKRPSCTEIKLSKDREYNDLTKRFLALRTTNDNCTEENQLCNKSLKEKESKIAQLEERWSRLNQPSNAANIFSSNRIIATVTEVKIRNGFIDPKYGKIPLSKRTHARHTRSNACENSLVTCEEEKLNITSTKGEEITRLTHQYRNDWKDEVSRCPEIKLSKGQEYNDLTKRFLVLRTTKDNCIEETQLCNKSLKEKESKIAQLEESWSRLNQYEKSSKKPTTILELTQSTTAPETTIKQTKLTAAISTTIPEPTRTIEPITLELTQSTTAPETTVKQTKLTAATSTTIPEPNTTTEPKITQLTNIQRLTVIIGSGLFAIGSLLAGAVIFMFKKKRRDKGSLHLANNLKTSQRQGHTQV